MNYEKKVLQQTAVMVNDSTNINKMNNYLSHQIIANNKDLDIIMPMEIQFLDRDNNVAGVPLNWSIGSQSFILTTGSPMAIQL